MTASDFGHLSRRYPLGQPNEPIVLYQGPAVLNDQELDVTVEFGWQPTPGVRVLVDDLPHLTSWERGFTLGAGDKTLHPTGLGSGLPVAVERSPPLVLR